MNELNIILENDKIIYELRKNLDVLNIDLENAFFAHFTEKGQQLLETQQKTLTHIYLYLKAVTKGLETRDFIKEITK